MKAFARVRALRDKLLGVEPAISNATTEHAWYEVGQLVMDEIEWNWLRSVKLAILTEVRSKYGYPNRKTDR